MQQSVTVTGVKLSSQTVVITALLVTCKTLPDSLIKRKKMSSTVFAVYLRLLCLSFINCRCVLKMDHHCPWYELLEEKCTPHVAFCTVCLLFQVFLLQDGLILTGCKDLIVDRTIFILIMCFQNVH